MSNPTFAHQLCKYSVRNNRRNQGYCGCARSRSNQEYNDVKKDDNVSSEQTSWSKFLKTPMCITKHLNFCDQQSVKSMKDPALLCFYHWNMYFFSFIIIAFCHYIMPQFLPKQTHCCKMLHTDTLPGRLLMQWVHLHRLCGIK